jgi:hypothetical protein
MFYFVFAKIMETRLPAWIVPQVLSHSSRKQNVTGVATIHHSLGKVHSRPGDVGLFVQIRDFIYRAAMDSHADLQLGMTLECATDLERAEERRLGAISKNQHPTIPGRQSQDLPLSIGETKLFGAANDIR